MGLFREFNRLVRSGAFAVNSVIRNKERQGRASWRMWTSVTIFATSLVDFGSSLIRKGTRKNNSSKPNKKNKKQEKQEFRDNSKEFKKNREEAERTILKNNYDKNLSQQQSDQSIYEQIYSTPESTNVNAIPEHYEQVLTNLKPYFSYVTGFMGEGIYYEKHRIQVELYGNVSKQLWDMYMTQKIDGVDLATLPPEKRAELMDEFSNSNSRDLIKKTRLSFNARGIFDDNGVNYFDICSSASEILSTLSVDYGKNYLPFFLEILNNVDYLNTNGAI